MKSFLLKCYNFLMRRRAPSPDSLQGLPAMKNGQQLPLHSSPEIQVYEPTEDKIAAQAGILQQAAVFPGSLAQTKPATRSSPSSSYDEKESKGLIFAKDLHDAQFTPQIGKDENRKRLRLRKQMQLEPSVSLRKKTRVASYPEMEKRLCEWAYMMFSRGIKLVQRNLTQQAKKILAETNPGVDFKGSRGWIDNFRFRNPQFFVDFYRSKYELAAKRKRQRKTVNKYLKKG